MKTNQESKQVTEIQFAQVWVEILAIDLSQIKKKIMAKQGWTQESADRVELAYRQFLLICAVYGTTDLVPTADIDEIWHEHILTTRQYTTDCQAVFGHYLHHEPEYRDVGQEPSTNLRRGFQRTGMLFQQEFGVAYGMGDCNAPADVWCALLGRPQGHPPACVSLISRSIG